MVMNKLWKTWKASAILILIRENRTSVKKMNNLMAKP